MALTRSIRLPFDTVTTSSTTDVFFPVTQFSSAGGLGNARSWCEMRGRSGSIIAVPAFQTANDTRNPDTAVAIPMNGGQTGYANADGVYDPDSALTTMSTIGKKFVRFGWLIRVTSGTGSARVQGGVQAYF